MKRLFLEPDVLQTSRVEVDSIIVVVVVALIRNFLEEHCQPFCLFQTCLSVNQAKTYSTNPMYRSSSESTTSPTVD